MAASAKPLVSGPTSTTTEKPSVYAPFFCCTPEIFSDFVLLIWNLLKATHKTPNPPKVQQKDGPEEDGQKFNYFFLKFGRDKLRGLMHVPTSQT